MRKKSRIAVAAFASIVFIALLAWFYTSREPGRREAQIPNLASHGAAALRFPAKAASKFDAGPKAPWRRDQPDAFDEFHRDIRTGYGESRPSYPMNYQTTELLKARGVASTLALSKASSAPLPWIERGPGNVAGRTRSILVDPADPTFSTWILGSVGGGVWKTADAGRTWKELTKGLTNLATSTLAMAASNPNVIYAGTGEGFSNVDQISGSGVWKSKDRGQTWQQLASTANNTFRHVTRVIVDPQNENVVLASTAGGFRSEGENGIHRSTDGGQTWTRVYTATARVQQIIANPKNFKTQYAAVNATAILKSVDGGVTWNPSLSGLGTVGRLELAIAPTDTSRLYVSAEGTTARLYVSTDAGATWILPQVESTTASDFLGGQGWYDNTVAVHPYDRNTVYAGGVNVWRFDVKSGRTALGADFDNTQSFLALRNAGGQLGGGGIVLGSVAAANQPTLEIRFGLGKKQKAHRFTVPAGSTTNVAVSSHTYQNYVDVPFEVWDVDNNRQLMASFRDQAGNGQFELELFNSTRTYEFIFPQLEAYNAAAPSANIAKNGGQAFQQLCYIWPVLAPGGVWKPDSLPNSTLRVRWGISPVGTVARNIFVDVYRQFGGTPKGVHPDQHNVMFIATDPVRQQFRMLIGNDGGLALSDDGGTVFLQTGQAFNAPGALKGYNVSQFYGLDKMNGADRYIGGTQDNGSYFSAENPDAASEWAHAPSGDGFEAVWHYRDPNKILESSQGNNIYRSLDRGVSWKNVRPPGTGPFISRIAKSRQDPDLVFATASTGVLRSDNFASNWTVTTMPAGFVGSNSFSQVEISLASPQVVWAGHTMTTTVAPFVSTDGGLSFTATKPFGRNLGSLTGIATHPTDEKTAYALFSIARQPKILRTTDLGQTWIELSGFGTNTTSSNGFPDVAVFSLLVMPFDTNILWAGTEIGLFESKDGGNTWAYADNGLPPVTIWEMTIVNDEVAVATHGRGIWSVSLPQLAGYEPSAAMLSPRFREIGGGFNGVISAVAGLASPYDSSFVLLDGAKYLRFGANAAPKDSALKLIIPVAAPKTANLSLIAYRAGKVFRSGNNELDLRPLKAAQVKYNNDFNNTANSALDFFTSTGFSFSVATGFANGALNSPHNYANNQNYTATLLTPIIVAPGNATLSYDDVAIVEPGEPGSKFGDDDFYDYVVVEGSNDFGKTWKPLADGYDARDDARWLAAYDAAQPGAPQMFKNHVIDLLKTFPAREQILIRFRLFADAGTVGWGWLVENLMIQLNATSVASEDSRLPATFELSQNYPNPFNPSTKIKYALPKNSDVKIVVFNAFGQQVRALLQAKKEAGFHQIEWDGRNDAGHPVATGVYFYQLTAKDYVRTLKMLLIK
jgi:photosystem II stability/assembly factor-like uncharacterized protein